MRSVRLLPGFRVLCSAVLLSLLPIALLIAGRSLADRASGPASAVLAGSFQSELGCPGDWQPACLRSRLRDPDGDGLYAFATAALPAGTYEAEVVVDAASAEGPDVGAAGHDGGTSFTVATVGSEVHFRYDSRTHALDITVTAPDASTRTSSSTARARTPTIPRSDALSER